MVEAELGGWLGAGVCHLIEMPQLGEVLLSLGRECGRTVIRKA
jgi:hypothetical protein